QIVWRTVENSLLYAAKAQDLRERSRYLRKASEELRRASEELTHHSQSFSTRTKTKKPHAVHLSS
ncbi:MAG TPA: hypothetical protein VF088_00455, partial [Pyrinomonadaceae bacterium]